MYVRAAQNVSSSQVRIAVSNPQEEDDKALNIAKHII